MGDASGTRLRPRPPPSNGTRAGQAGRPRGLASVSWAFSQELARPRLADGISRSSFLSSVALFKGTRGSLAGPDRNLWTLVIPETAGRCSDFGSPR